MASEAAPTLVKSTPAAALQQDQHASTAAPTKPANTTTEDVTTSSTNSNKSNIDTGTSLPSILPVRGSSDEFGTSGSLGSIGGSAVGYGSSLEFCASGGLGELGTSSNGSSQNNSLKARISPSGRRPFRKRKASVDFSFPALSIDDNDSSYLISQLLPQQHGTGSAKTPTSAGGTSLIMLPSPSGRNRLYSDLTIPEALITTSNNLISAQSKQKQNQSHHDRNNDHQQEQILPSVDALPAIGDDLLPPIDTDSTSIILNHPAMNHPESPVSNSNQNPHNNFTIRKDRGLSFASSRTEGHGVDRLDSLGLEATISASRIRKGSSVASDKSPKSQENATEDSINSNGNNSYDGTLGSQSHRFLMEAFLGDGTESLVLNPSQRERLGSLDAAAEITGKTHGNSNKDSHGSSSNQNNGTNILISRERLSSIGGRRNRLESWGGMSDLSVGMKDLRADQNLESLGVGIFAGTSTNNSNNSGSCGAGAGSTDKTAALAATIYTSLANDVSAAAGVDGNESISSFLVKDEKIPTKISVNRDRLNSIASIGTDASALIRFSALNGDTTDSEFPSDVHSFVQAAMASVEDQLADLATAVEAVSKDNKGDQESEISSSASPLIGAASDVGSNRSMDSVTGRPRSSSISSMLQISVDYDAVAAAVDAAEAAAGALDLSSFTLPSNSVGASSSSSIGSHTERNRKKRSLPTQKKPPHAKKKKSIAGQNYSAKGLAPKNRTKKRVAAAGESPPLAKGQCVGSTKKKTSNLITNEQIETDELKASVVPKSKLDDRDMEKLRERARAAAGYVRPPATCSSTKTFSLPPKKRSAAPATPSHPPRSSALSGGGDFKTPIMSNTATSKYLHTGTPVSGYSAGTPSSSTKGQSSQKWESMFDCLLQFIEQRKKDGTAGMTEELKAEWAWDGNVPTTFKTKDGKALGRWVNNQRSAKSKGTLKKERETRLVNAGLKWSVLASNSWNEMLEELRIYVADQIKQGKKWDGNVPTNYRIKVSRDKSKPFLKEDDEDKNLGRWVNRQRSMFQAGKLRKERQLALERIGLKWSMLATTSWESMFETLCQYVESKKKGGNEWDGNVPANYRTEDVPPRALGRWINRQRSAYGKTKLKPEYVVKLNEIGLKWSIHERRPTYHQYTRPDTTSSSTTKGVDVVKNTGRKIIHSTTAQRTQNTSKDPSPVVVTSAAKPLVADKSANDKAFIASVAKKAVDVVDNEIQSEKSVGISRPDTVESAESLSTSKQQVKKTESLVTREVMSQQVNTVVPTTTASGTKNSVTRQVAKATTSTDTTVATDHEDIANLAQRNTISKGNRDDKTASVEGSNDSSSTKLSFDE